MNRILSGIQPTGNIHIGNYLGAIRNWVSLQRTHECLFMIADLHAITVQQDPDGLRESTLKTAALYIACGIDPEISPIFPQSHVRGHTELAWILGCNTPIGWLNRMTQFKDKSGKNKERAGWGLYSYPILMAADILLYNATHVPVGNDQCQHLELARDMAGAFNRDFNAIFFNIPEPLISDNGARIMSLKDGQEKMSKSDASTHSRIHLIDPPEVIRDKLRRAKSDLQDGITYTPERPEVSNLLRIAASLNGEAPELIAARLTTGKVSELKTTVADALIETLEPIRCEYERLMQDKGTLLKILQKGSQAANHVASETLDHVYKITGLL